jgi:hypothetical protein
MSSLTFKQKTNAVYELCSTLCPICKRQEIGDQVLLACDENDTLVDYEVLFEAVVAKLDVCSKCESKEEIYEE